MRLSGSFKTLLAKTFLFIWSALCVFLFVVFPGSISHIHQFFNFGSWQEDISSKILAIDPFYYAGNLALGFIGATLFFISYVSFGILCLKAIRIISSDKAWNFYEYLALIGSAFLVGRGILSVIFLLLAGLYEMTPQYVVFIMATCFLVGLRPSINFLFQNYRKWDIRPFFQINNKLDTFLLLLSALTIFLALMYSSSRLSYDSVAIYFSNAKITAMTKHIQFFSNEPLTASAFQDGIQYAAIIQVFGDQAARIYSWVNGIVIITLSLALGEKLGFSRRTKLILLTLLLTSTAFLDLMGDGKIDLASSAPILAAVYWMVADEKNRTKTVLLLIGFFSGMGMISRPYNIFLEGAFIGFFYLFQAFKPTENKKLDFKPLLKSALWISPGVILLFVYLLVANWVISGNPISPLLNILNYKIANWDWPFDPNDIWKFRLFYFFVITFSNSSHSLGTISPLFLAFLPGIFIAEIRKTFVTSKVLISITIATLITLIAWITLFFTILEIRYILFLWIILFMFGAQMIERALDCKELLFRTLLSSILIITLSFVALRTVYISLDTYSPLDKQGHPHCYESMYCTFLEPVNAIASLGDRVLTLSAYRYYLRPDLFACSSKREEYLTLEELSRQDSAAFWSEVYRQGYKFVTYEENYGDAHLHFAIKPDPKNTPEWLTLKPIYGPEYESNGEFQASYQISVSHPPVTVEKTCIETEAQIWEVQSVVDSKH